MSVYRFGYINNSFHLLPRPEIKINYKVAILLQLWVNFNGKLNLGSFWVFSMVDKLDGKGETESNGGLYEKQR